jgi:hypothetical protein
MARIGVFLRAATRIIAAPELTDMQGSETCRCNGWA